MTSFDKIVKSLIALLNTSAYREKVNGGLVRLQDYYSIMRDI